MLVIRKSILALFVLLASVGNSSADEPLLLVGADPVAAAFVGTDDDGSFKFQFDEQLRSTTQKDLVRWGTPRSPKGQRSIVLSDGSQLMLADEWTGQPSWTLQDGKLLATTRLMGKLKLPLPAVRAIVLRLPADAGRRTQLYDQVLANKQEATYLLLTNGDQFSGELVGHTQSSEGKRQLEFQVPLASNPTQVPVDRVTAIVFLQGTEQVIPQEDLVVGLRDGSLVTTSKLVADRNQLRIQLASGLELVGADKRDVVYLRSLTANCQYLSDLTASGYRHISYLDLPWPYRRDRNVLAGSLQSHGQIYDKGLGTHSASRLTYRLDTPELQGKYQQFRAKIAIDDSAARRGSVVFRVYLEKQGKWQQAFTSPVIRGGDQPVQVNIPLAEATQIALLTDFADRGDECDYANWLEARIE